MKTRSVQSCALLCVKHTSQKKVTCLQQVSLYSTGSNLGLTLIAIWVSTTDLISTLVCMCECMCVYMHVCMHNACTHTHTYTYMRTQTCMHAHRQTDTQCCVGVMYGGCCVRVCVYACMRVCVYVCVCVACLLCICSIINM